MKACAHQFTIAFRCLAFLSPQGFSFESSRVQVINSNGRSKWGLPDAFDRSGTEGVYAAQCDYPGGMFSIELEGGKPAAFDFLRHLHIGRNAVSLGGVETLACHSKTTTHSGFSEEEFRLARATED